MGVVLFLCILLWTSAFTRAQTSTSGEGENNGDYSDFIMILVPLCIVILITCTIRFCCCRNRTREGYTRLNNDNEGSPPWDPRQPTHVIIQPVIAVRIPTENPNFGAPAGMSGAVPSMPADPPGYDESIKNTPMPSQFINSPMPNQFANPPMPNQFINLPMPNNFNNQSVPGNFNNPSAMPSGLNISPMPKNFNNLPPKYPNA